MESLAWTRPSNHFCIYNVQTFHFQDGSGYVSLSEYKQFLNVESGSMEEEELNAAFREMDSGEADFRLSLDEFLKHNAKLTASMNDTEFNQYVDEICGVSTVA